MPLLYMHIEIHPHQQLLTLHDGDHILARYAVATAKNGLGEQMHSEKTPRGWHFIRAKIGEGQPSGAVFVGRRPTGEIYSAMLARQYPQRDWILSRILWLCGSEPGFNRFKNVDTMRRYVYIHGTPDENIYGEPNSHGCIRMKNQDVIELFEQIPNGCKVYIHGDVDD